MKNDLIRGRRWYALLAGVLLVAFAAYYGATGNAVPRYEYFFRAQPWALEHLMRGDMLRIWTVFIAPLFMVAGMLMLRVGNNHDGGRFIEAALFIMGGMMAVAGIAMLPWGVTAGLFLWVAVCVALGALGVVISALAFVFTRAT